MRGIAKESLRLPVAELFLELTVQVSIMHAISKGKKTERYIPHPELRVISEDVMPSEYPKVPPTKENCEADYRDKVKLNEEFKEFEKLVEDAAKRSPEVKELIVPLKKLEQWIIAAAHGRHFVPDDHKKGDESS
jgi:hypothetical protein